MATRQDKPNVLFIISDQHNAKVLGHKGHPDAITPSLDRLAEEGVRFDNAISQNPICTPSRMSFLSGQYCHNHGYYGLSGPHPGGLPNILGHFRSAGYATAAVGKIHCPEYWIEDEADHFREVSGCSIGGNAEYVAYLRERGVLKVRMAEQYKNPYGGQCYDGIYSKLDYRDSAEGWVVTETVQFMEQAIGDGKPFLAHVSLPKPHQLYTPSKPFWDMYDPSSLTLPPSVDYEMQDKPPHLIAKERQWREGRWAVFEPRTYEAARLRKLRGYLGCVTHVDHAVGELLDWLDQRSLAEDTIVIYTSDHGDYACEHGIMEKAPGICADAITRIPFIWRWPGHFQAGHVAAEIVESVDLSATLCGLAGCEPMWTSDGQDLTDLLRGRECQVHDIGVTEFAWSKSVRKGSHRLVYYPREMFVDQYPDGFGELYDLESDPWEMENLYFRPEYAHVARELERDLLDWLVTTTRPATVLPAFKGTGSLQERLRYGNATYRDNSIHPDWLRNRLAGTESSQLDSFMVPADRKNYV